MVDLRYIRKHYDKYQVRIPQDNKRISLGNFNTAEEAASARDEFLKINITKEKISDKPRIYGILPQENVNINSIWDLAEISFSNTLEREKIRSAQRIEFSDKPIAIALLSDLHIGNATTDYKQLRYDADLIKKTDGMYAIFHGDGIDNWIIPKLAQLQRGQAVNFEQELLLFESWLEILLEKLIVVVSGNHDNWTHSLAGIDIVKKMLKTTKVLYDRDEVRTVIKVGQNEWTFCIRHKWLGSSIYNPTHGIERYSRMGASFDVGIGGHTHIASLSREFVGNDNRQCMAIITGTYKKYDGFARQLGLPQCAHNGSGAIILQTNGKMMWIRDLQEASEYITYLRKK
jgi:predicted phosphodiesterase